MSVQRCSPRERSETVREVKASVRDFAEDLSDVALLRDIELAMDRERATVEKRRVAMGRDDDR